MQMISREGFLSELESVKAGLAPREIIEQSTCFIFREGKVVTYNDEVACFMQSSLKIEGAVRSAPLLSILHNLKSDLIEIKDDGDEIRIIAGKSRSVGIRKENEILLPIDKIEAPKKWKSLPPDFCEAIYLTSQCACKDESQFVITCLHLTDSFVEATDNFQLSRYPLKFKLKTPCLLRKESIKHVADLDMTEFSETQSWIHFRNPSGLILSCRRSPADDFPNLDKLIKSKGMPATLPPGLEEATTNAQIFSQENADNDNVSIELSPKDGGRLKIHGEGASGWYREVKKLKYSGKKLNFRIAPKLLIEISKRHNECEIGQSVLVVKGTKFKYVTCLEVTADA